MLNARFFFLRQLTLAAKQPGIEFGGEQRVLKAFHGPVENGDDHFRVHVGAQFAALQAEAHEGDGSVRIFGDQKTINFPLQRKIGAIVAEQRNAIRNPIFAQQMFGADQPIIQDIEKSSGANWDGCVQIFWERMHRSLVDFEKEAIFTTKMLEDGTLCNTERGGHVAHPGGMVSVLSKMLHGDIDDAGTLHCRARPLHGVRRVAWWIDGADSNFAHK